jgi:hypothetical protein
MLDIVGALFVGAYLATLVSALVWSSSRSIRWRLGITAAFSIWLGIVLALTRVGVFAHGTLGPFPPGLAPFAVLLISMLAGWRYRSIRDALFRLERPLLIGLHAFRVGGLLFVLLGVTGRLAPVFALTAGIGDVLVGASALFLSVRLAAGARISRRASHIWNAFGMLDLVLALTIGVLSVPGSPLGILGSEPGMRTMTAMPWILVPAAIVPLLFLTHLVIARAGSREFAASARSPGSVPAATGSTR